MRDKNKQNFSFVSHSHKEKQARKFSLCEWFATRKTKIYKTFRVVAHSQQT